TKASRQPRPSAITDSNCFWHSCAPRCGSWPCPPSCLCCAPATVAAATTIPIVIHVLIPLPPRGLVGPVSLARRGSAYDQSHIGRHVGRREGTGRHPVSRFAAGP